MSEQYSETRRAARMIITKIVPYFLGQDINTASDLKEFSDVEYSLFEREGIFRTLDDERFFHGKKLTLIELPWDIIVSSTQGKIYKIVLQQYMIEKKASNRVFKEMLGVLTEKMGKYTEHPFFSKRYIWDTSEGNMILMQGKKYAHPTIHVVYLFITASFIREQRI